MFFDGSKFHEHFLKEVTQGTILWNYFKIQPAVSRANFEEFLLSPHSAKKSPPPHGGHVFRWIRFREQFLKRVTQETILWNYSKFWPAVSEETIFKEFLQVHTAQKASPMVAMFLYRSKFRVQLLKRVTEGTILWNYFKIGPSVSEEKIFKEFLEKNPFGCLGNQSFWWNQILRTTFKEDHPRNIPAKFGSNWPCGLGGVDV